MKKIIFTIVAATIIFLAVGLNVKAAETFKLPDEFEYYEYTFAFVDANAGDYVIVTTPYPCTEKMQYVGNNTGTQWPMIEYRSVDHGANYTKTSTNTFNYSAMMKGSQIMYSNYDIYNYSTGELFFQKPPVEVIPEAPTLVGTMNQETAMKTLEPVMILIPTGLACLVGFLALRKALSLLQQIFHKA